MDVNTVAQHATTAAEMVQVLLVESGRTLLMVSVTLLLAYAFFLFGALTFSSIGSAVRGRAARPLETPRGPAPGRAPASASRAEH